MDKKNTIIGLLLFMAAFGLMFYQGANQPKRQPVSPTPEQTSANPAAPIPAPETVDPAAPASNATTQVSKSVATATSQLAPEKTYVLSNELMEATFTTHGGGIKEVSLTDFAKTLDSEERYIINEIRYASMLDISSGLYDFKGASFTVSEQSADSITLVANIDNKLEIHRRYTISQNLKGPDPYLIRHEIDFRNLTDQAISTSNFRMNIGTFDPTGQQGEMYLTFGYDDGEDQEFYASTKFQDSNFVVFSSEAKEKLEEKANIRWASMKNQFFLTILTPDDEGTGFLSLPVPHIDPISQEKIIGMTGYVDFDAISVPAGSAKTLGFNFYAGPKEHDRIQKLKNNEEQAMEFGWLGWISKGLLLLLGGLQKIVVNWGLAIICLTLVVRFVLLPINLISSKSMKRMGKLAEPMKQLKEAFPDNQQKQQQLMMELYKLNKVNPVAGCLPLLLQMPIFFGLFYMLRNAAELRFAEFLWIPDLSVQEGLFTMPFSIPFLGDQFNILPILMSVTMYYQMKMTPTPSVDNAQAKMMKFMPIIFFPITYTFASGLVLYWTVSNIFTILQTWLINRGQSDFEVVLPAALQKALDKDGKKPRRKKKK